MPKGLLCTNGSVSQGYLLQDRTKILTSNLPSILLPARKTQLKSQSKAVKGRCNSLKQHEWEILPAVRETKCASVGCISAFVTLSWEEGRVVKRGLVLLWMQPWINMLLMLFSWRWFIKSHLLRAPREWMRCFVVSAAVLLIWAQLRWGLDVQFVFLHDTDCYSPPGKRAFSCSVLSVNRSFFNFWVLVRCTFLLLLSASSLDVEGICRIDNEGF